MIRYILKIIKGVSKNHKNSTAGSMETVPKQKTRSWGHRLREENNGLREKIVTLRKENARLKKDLEKAWELMAHIPGGLFLLQQETIVYANKAACGWLGYSLGELAGKSLLEIIDAEDVQSIQAFIRGKAGTQTPDALRFKNREGRSVYCAIHIKKTRYEGRKAFLLNLIEIERKIEQEKTILEGQKFEALQRVAGAFAGESTGTTDNSLLQNLAVYARKGYEPSEISPLNLNRMLEKSVSRYCAEKGIRCEQDDDSENKIHFKTALHASSPINGCQKELQNAFMNLIANAAEALETSNEIYLTAQEKPGVINFYLQENGCGIRENDIDKIFDPFFTTKGNPHKGLGLSLARAVFERHGGSIRVIRHEAGGTTLHVTLPLDHDAFKTSAPPKRKSIKDSKILLIGDQNILINLLFRFLSAKQLDVTRVDTYGECFKVLKSELFDLLLVDHHKSMAKTEWLIRKVRQTNPELAIVLFNVSKSDKPDISKTPGIDLLVPKPIHVGGFYSSISRLISEGKTSQKST